MTERNYEKKQLETIADLNFTWIFDTNQCDRLRQVSENHFKNHNPHVENLKIIPHVYKFHIGNFSFNCYGSLINKEISNFIMKVDFEVFNLQLKGKINKFLTLDKFEKVSNTEYRIHVKESIADNCLR